MEIIVILFLIILNGLFSMAETAIISSRKSRLSIMASEGNLNAKAALELAKSPNKFISSMQLGITMVGIFTGAFGGATIASKLAHFLHPIPFIGSYSDPIALVLVVGFISYLALVVGELFPKRLALNNPEKIAAIAARPTNLILKVTSPFVALLSVSTDFLLTLFGIEHNVENSVSEEEIKMMIKEGARTGIFNLAESDIVERTFRLSDKKVNTLMSHRQEIIWLDVNSTFEAIRSKISKYPHANFPVCAGNLDNVVGIVNTEDILRTFLLDKKIDLRKSVHKPLFIPETIEAIKVLELFKQSGVHMALVIDEYGSILGILSLTDILEEIVGDIPTVDEIKDLEIVKRDDGSYLIDGLISIDKFKEKYQIKKLPGEKDKDFQTLGGFVMDKLDRIPQAGDSFEWDTFKFEVMDMDGNRVDKILLTKI